jgi:isopentenyldiphosphate isomerase
MGCVCLAGSWDTLVEGSNLYISQGRAGSVRLASVKFRGTLGGGLPAMLIDAVDQADRPVGRVTRGEVLSVHANFRVAHVLLFNSRGELLIQKLAHDRKRHPGYWGSSVAAYVYSQETYEQAAKRRLYEELGVRAPKLQALGKTSMDDDGSRKFISVFSTVHDGPISYDSTHIATVQFVTVTAIRNLISSGERLFTPTFLCVLDFYQRLSTHD